MKCGRIYGLLPQIGCKGTNISLIYKMLGQVFLRKKLQENVLKKLRWCTENYMAVYCGLYCVCTKNYTAVY